VLRHCLELPPMEIRLGRLLGLELCYLGLLLGLHLCYLGLQYYTRKV
jgi:hypothetical protein